MKWHNETRKIEDLKPSDYNPRKLGKKEEKNLEDSLDHFGMADVIVVNKDGRIIGGHQRYALLKKQGVVEVDVRVPEEQLSLEQEKELNLRLNKNLGEFDKEVLKDFDKDLLEKVGFEERELETIFGEPAEKPEIEFTTEILEANNYVVFTFDNIMDWQVIQEKFGLVTRQSLDSTEDYHRSGVGRVVDGKALLRALDVQDSAYFDGITEAQMEAEPEHN